MAYDNGYTAITGGTLSAAQWNTHVRDNFSALWVYTTAGDISYATGATGKSRLAIGTAGYILESSGSAPRWAINTRYYGTPLSTSIAAQAGDDAARFRIPAAINGWSIVSVAASRKSGTGTPTIQLRNVTDAVDVLSTRVTIDTGETDSSSAATAAVINASYKAVATADQFAIDIDDAGTNSLYLYFEVGFRQES